MKSKNLRLLIVFSTLIFIGINVLFVVLPGKGVGQMCLNSARTPIGYMSDTDCWTLGGAVDKGNQGLPPDTSEYHAYFANEQLRMFISNLQADKDILEKTIVKLRVEIESRTQQINVMTEKMNSMTDFETPQKITFDMGSMTKDEVEAKIKELGFNPDEFIGTWVGNGTLEIKYTEKSKLNSNILELRLANVDDNIAIMYLQKNLETITLLEMVAIESLNTGGTLAVKLNFDLQNPVWVDFWYFSPVTNVWTQQSPDIGLLIYDTSTELVIKPIDGGYPTDTIVQIKHFYQTKLFWKSLLGKFLGNMFRVRTGE